MELYLLLYCTIHIHILVHWSRLYCHIKLHHSIYMSVRYSILGFEQLHWVDVSKIIFTGKHVGSYFVSMFMGFLTCKSVLRVLGPSLG